MNEREKEMVEIFTGKVVTVGTKGVVHLFMGGQSKE